MFFRRVAALSFACSLVPSCALCSTLEQVLALMDTASASFRDMSAKLKRIDHTAVIDDTTEETGTVRMKRSGSREMRMLTEFDEPDRRTVAFADRKAEVYYPKIRTVQVYDLGKYRELVDQFLLLGFGTSGKELEKNYAIKLAGEEKIDGDPVVRLELVPKAASAQKHLKKVELWISAGGGYPLQQKFHRPSGDYTLIQYADLKINPNLPDGALRLKLPAGVKREYPQK